MKLLLLLDALTSKLPRSIPWLALHQSWVVSVGCQCLSSLLTLERKGFSSCDLSEDHLFGGHHVGTYWRHLMAAWQFFSNLLMKDIG